MQLRFQTAFTGEEYVRHQAWRAARLPRCPFHPQGGCGFARHGTYARVIPQGTRVARWYCPQAHCTFSLLPDFLASRLSGSLDDLERVVIRIEQSRSMEAAADALRTDNVGLPGAIRWARRRMSLVHDALMHVMHAFPGRFASQPSVTVFQRHLTSAHVLLCLRTMLAAHLQVVPAPLGFAARPSHDTGTLRRRVVQHHPGPAPPIYWR